MFSGEDEGEVLQGGEAALRGGEEGEAGGKEEGVCGRWGWRD